MAGEVLEAVQAQLATVQSHLGDIEARRTLGLLYLANGAPREAAIALEQAMQLGDRSAQTLYLLATAHEMSGDLEAALTAMGHARGVAPDARHLLWRPGFWLLEDGRPDEALALFQRAGQLETAAGGPQADGAAWRIGQARSLMDLDRPAEAIAPLEELNTLLDHFYVDYLLAQASRRAGRTQDIAIAQANGNIQPPSYPDPWWDEVSAAQRGTDGRIARIDELLEAGRLKEAAAAITQARDQWPQDVNILNRLSDLHRRQGNTKAWIRTLKQAGRLDPSHAATQYNLSVAYQQSGKLDEALNHAHAAVKANPSLTQGWLQIARLLVITNKLDRGARDGDLAAVNQALVPLDRAFSLGVDVPGEQLMYGHLLLRGNRLDDAQRVLQRVTQSPNGGDPRAWAVLSDVYAAKVDHPSALRTAIEGLNRFPNQPNLIRIVDRYRRATPGTTPTPGSSPAP